LGDVTRAMLLPYHCESAMGRKTEKRCQDL
jgi:hypothetical protein